MKPSHLIRRDTPLWWRDFDPTPTDEIARVFGAPARPRRITRTWLYRKGKRIEVVHIPRPMTISLRNYMQRVLQVP